MRLTAGRYVSPLVVLLFFASGVLGLVYEVIWIRKLSLVFGSTNVALSAVLGIFFGGLALGSYLFGRIAQRSRNLIRLYAWLEIGIGAWAFLFPTLLDAIDHGYGLLYPQASTSFLLLTVTRILLVVPLILVPTTLMGGTLPLLSRYFVQRRSHLSARVGALYALNTFGGALGTFLCGFFFIYHLGVNTTNYWAAALNVGVGVGAWWVGRHARTSEPVPAAEPQAAATSTSLSPRLVTLVVLAFGISGLTSIAYEVIWARYLSLFMLSSVYAYSTILTVFLLGLVLGSLVFSWFFDRREDLVEIFGYLQIGVGVSSLVLLPALVAVQPAVAGAGSIFMVQFLIAAVLMIVPTTLMGATLPLVSRIATVHISGVGRVVGRLYAVNTLGGIAGSVLGGFLLLQWLGIADSTRLLAAMNLALGVAAIALEPNKHRWRSATVLASGVVLAVASQTFIGRQVPEDRLLQIAGSGHRILVVDEGLVNTVWVTEDGLGRKALWTNDSIMGRTGRPYRNDLSAQRVQGHIPMLMHPGEPKQVLGIALGTGQTLGAQLLYPIERLDVVDISETVIRVSLEHFAEHQNGLGEDPRVRIIIDDGLAYVRRTTESYDVISLEMPPHEEAGIVHFYTVDFYRALLSRLRPDGVVAQWVPIYNVTPEETVNVVRTFIEVFPQSAFWHNATDLLLLGYNGEFAIDPGVVRRKLERQAVAEDLAVSYLDGSSPPINRVDRFLASFLIGPEGLAELSKEGQVYTDDRPELEFTWTKFPVWGIERRDLLVLENVRLVEGRLNGIERYLRGEEAVPALDPIRRSYLDQLKAAAYDNLGTYAARDYPEQALGFYRKAIATRPDFAQAHNNLGTLLLDGDRVVEALALYQNAVRLDPDYAQAHYNLGVACGRQGMRDQAVEAFAEAIRIRPDYAPAHSATGRQHFEAGDLAEAEQCFRDAIGHDPAHADGYWGLARLLTQQGRLGEAIEAMETLTRLLPDEAEAREILQRLKATAAANG